MEPEPTSSLSDELNKKRNTSAEATQETSEDTQTSTPKQGLATPLTGVGSVPAAGSGKKQQNNFLLFNAMRTTATHASTTFSSSRASVDQSLSELSGSGSAEGLTIITTSASVGGRTSVTPTPQSAVQQPDATPRVPATVPGASAAAQELPPGKGAPAGGTKKKRKRKFLDVVYFVRSLFECPSNQVLALGLRLRRRVDKILTISIV
jgi:mediator of RNA polymerase II transcription subunit 6